MSFAVEAERGRMLKRRDILRFGAAGFAAFLGGSILGCDVGPGGQNGGLADAIPTPTPPVVPPPPSLGNLGPLLAPDANGIMLPAGFSSRVVARSGQKPVAGGYHVWHSAPDGGAVFPAAGGGWIYVSNSEMDSGAGGVSALQFDAAGNVVDSYSILTGTSRNCAGGRGLAGQWFSCEENGDGGRVFECDPTGSKPAVFRPALGRFNHEAVAFDAATGIVYMTEDHPEGGLYRFIPDSDLTSGTLQVLRVVGGGLEGPVTWANVPDPSGSPTPTRSQVSTMTRFDGGEGIVCRNQVVYFATKGDNRVWAFDIKASSLVRVYDFATSPTPILAGVDNLEITPDGDLVVAEDEGDMQIVTITPAGKVAAILQVVGQDASEITGPAFTPDRKRLYFSSQRGTTGASGGGITYEISGPWAG